MVQDTYFYDELFHIIVEMNVAVQIFDFIFLKAKDFLLFSFLVYYLYFNVEFKLIFENKEGHYKKITKEPIFML